MSLLLAFVLLAPQDHPKVSPFGGLRWAGDDPEVLVAETWYRLVAIDGTPAAEILDFCKETWGKDWQRRFGEDLFEAMRRMGKRPRPFALLQVKEPDTGKVREVNVQW